MKRGGSSAPRWAALLGLAAAVPHAARAGGLDEFWPELDVWYSFSESTRGLLTVAGTRSASDGDRADAQIAAYVDHRLNDRISLRAGYLQAMDPVTETGETVAGEHRLVFDFNYRWRFGEHTVLGDRTRLDLRDLQGDDSYRIRNRLRVDHDLQDWEWPLTPYAFLEAYYDQRFDAISRWRTEFGVTLPGKRIEWDLYYVWQQEVEPERDTVTGIGVTLNLKF